MSWERRDRRESAGWGNLLAQRLAEEGVADADIDRVLDVSLEWVRAQVDDPDNDPVPAAAPIDAAGPEPIDAAGPEPARPLKAHQGYQHEAFLYRGPHEFLAGAVPFVREGVAMRQPVLVAVGEPRLTLLRDALGADAAAVRFVDMARLGANPARIIPRWQRFVEECSGPHRPVRGIGEPIWNGRGAAELVEFQLHEALLNVAVDADTPLWLSCPYDVDALPPEVIVEAMHSHPILLGADGYHGSTRYDGVEHVAAMFRTPLPEPDVEADRLGFRADDLPALRDCVTRNAIGAGIHSDRALALTVAMTEIADGSLRYGGGGGELRVWRAADALVCEIRDRGHLDDPMLGRRPAAPGEKGYGAWFANQVCDLTQVRATGDGTVIRVHSGL
jgi:hypothetical protein